MRFVMQWENYQMLPSSGDTQFDLAPQNDGRPEID